MSCARTELKRRPNVASRRLRLHAVRGADANPLRLASREREPRQDETRRDTTRLCPSVTRPVSSFQLHWTHSLDTVKATTTDSAPQLLVEA